MVVSHCGRSVLLLIMCCATLAWGDTTLNIMKKEVEILDDILNSTRYDHRIRPLENREAPSPTQVRVNMFVRMISDIDDVKMQYEMQVTFRQQWTDDRLKFDDMGGKIKNLDIFDIDTVKFWTPDLFFSNEKSGHMHDLVKPNIYIRIFPSGSVLYSARISLTLSCFMNLQRYPFDRQVCSIRMASYGYTTEDVIFEWKEGDPVQVVRNLDLAQFSLTKFLTGSCTSQTNTGSYSCLKVDFLLDRNLSYHLIQVFIPSTMLVLISWVSFWLDMRAVVTRLILVLSTLLVLSVQVAGVNAGLAAVSYTRSLDVWTGTCLTFIFAALLELATVDYTWRRLSKKQRGAAGVLDATTDDENGTAFDMNPLVNTGTETTNQNRARQNDVAQASNFFYRWVSKLPAGPKRLDILSRCLFPICFALFNIFYWFSNLIRY